MTLTQKLDLIKPAWGDISKDDKAIESPRWHEKVLQDRQKALDTGKTSAHQWEEAKEEFQEERPAKVTILDAGLRQSGRLLEPV